MALTWGAILLLEVGRGATITMGGVEITLTPCRWSSPRVILVGLIWLLFKLVGLSVALFFFFFFPVPERRRDGDHPLFQPQPGEAGL